MHVRCCLQRGDTTLHWAARGGHDEVARLLLGAGAPVDAVDQVGGREGGGGKSWEPPLLPLCPIRCQHYGC